MADNLLQPPFLRLPAELRNRIYNEVLLETEAIPIKLAVGFMSYRSWKPPGILRTCRTIRSEAAPIYYGSNTFKLDAIEYMYGVKKQRKAVKRLQPWFKGLGNLQRNMLRTVYLGGLRYKDVEDAKKRVRTFKRFLKGFGVRLANADGGERKGVLFVVSKTDFIERDMFERQWQKYALTWVNSLGEEREEMVKETAKDPLGPVAYGVS